MSEIIIRGRVIPEECTHQIQVGEKAYSCDGKKYTEINRRHTGIACKGNHLWGDFIKEYQHVEG